MNIFEQKINYILSALTGVLGAILGDFWFLFIFLLLLNVIDYTTGILKARYLKVESSRKATKGFIKKFLLWCLIAMGFGLGIVFEKVGEVINIDLSIMIAIGWFLLAHCIINEFRSILENIIELDKGHLVPSWLVKGLEVSNKAVHKKVDNFIDKIDEKINK